MQEQIIGKIITTLSSSLKLNENEAIEFALPGYKAIPISKGNFHAIEQSNKENNVTDEISEASNTLTTTKIAFIDGGNTELLSAANFSLQFVRVFGCIFQDNKRIFSKKHEFYVLARCVNRLSDEGKPELAYSAEIFPVNGEQLVDASQIINAGQLIDSADLLFAANDETIRDGIHNANISTIGEIARKFGELSLAKQIVNELNENDIIVLDGSLQATVTNHKKYLEQLYSAASAKKVIVSALAKTSRLFTNNGNSIVGLLNEVSINTEVDGAICKNIAWYYYPSVEIDNEAHRAELFFAKLNKASEYVFRFEVFKENLIGKDSDYLSIIFSALANNSRDLTFPGYPYGLMFADRLARVSNNEKEYLTTLFQAKAGKSWSVIKKYLNAVNAHGVLDRIG